MARYLVVSMLGMALLLGIPGFGSAQEATPAAPATIDGRVDIGGRSLYLHCEGSGSPTILLESDLQQASSSWDLLLPEIAGISRVCSYDRAGMGLSDLPPTGPRTISSVAADLHALLTAAGISGPLVLVGDQIGSTFVRFYASVHPEDVAGIVLINPAPYTRDEFERYLAILPPDGRAQQLAGAQGENTEGLDLEPSTDDQEAVPAPPLVPAILLAPGQSDVDLMPADWPAEAIDTLLRQIQDEQARALGAHLVVAEQSNSLIQLNQPELVVDAARQVVEAARDPESWQATPTP
jgi:pimeloyl-ACP methyl ester carboxylesterase